MVRNLYILSNVELGKDLGILSPGVLSPDTFIKSGSKVNGNIYTSDFGVSDTFQINSPSLLKSGSIISFGSSITVSPTFKNILNGESYIDVTEFGNITKHPDFHKLTAKYSNMIKEKEAIESKIDSVDNSIIYLSDSFDSKKDEYQKRIKTLQDKNMNLIFEKDLDKEEISKLVENEKNLINETKKFKDLLSEKKCQIESLERNLKEMENEFAFLVSSKGDGKNLVNKLSGLFSKLYGSSLKISNITSVKDSIDSMIKRSDEDINFSNQTINQLNKTLLDENKTLDELKNDLISANSDKNMLLQIMKSIIDEYHKGSNNEIKEKDAVNEAISKLIQDDYELTEIKKQFTLLSNENNEMKAFLELKISENDELKRMLELSNLSLFETNSTNKELEELIKELNNREINKENDDRLVKLLESRNEEIKSLQKNLEDMAFSHQIETREKEEKEEFIISLKQELDLARLKIKNLEKVISSTNNNSEDLLELIRDLSEQLKNSKIQLTSKDEKIKLLKSENEHLKHNLIENGKSELFDQNKILNLEYKDLEELVQNCNIEISKYQSENDNLNSSLKESINCIEELNQEKDKLSGKVKILEEFIQNYGTEISKYQTENDNLNSSLKESLNCIEILNQEKDKLSGTVKRMEDNNKKLIGIISKNEYGKTILTLKEQLSTVNDNNLKLSSDILTSLEEVDLMSNTITDINNKFLESRDEYEKILKLNKDYVDRMDIMIKEKERLLEIIDNLNSQILSMRPKCNEEDTDSENKINILENDLATLCVEHEKLLNEYKVYKDKCKTAEENSKFSEIKINDLSSLLASFHLKCENISKFDFPLKISSRVTKLVDIESEIGKIALFYKSGRISADDFIKRGEELEQDKKRTEHEIDELFTNLTTCLKM